MAILDRLPHRARPKQRPAVAARQPKRHLRRRHVLMLALAAEVLFVGFANAGRYRPPGIIVEQTLDQMHIIT